MGIRDPREEYDDLLVADSREELPPEEFADATATEAATVGWTAFAFVFDDEGRVLLLDQPWADGWLTPGGVRKPRESLAETVVREVREETGVEVTPVRPRAVDEFTFVNEETGERDGWTTVLFEAAADSTDLDEDLGLADEEIRDARWFDGLPENVFNAELTTAAFERCANGDPA